MPPDFSKRTAETLAKRAAFRCSNPDCRTLTVGPNEQAEKSTNIGEAAHIHGARPQALRYLARMTDAARAEITNGIWLCRNCHKLVDQDEQRYSAGVLFAWRATHEAYVAGSLGAPSDQIAFAVAHRELDRFSKYPAIVSRIIMDKPEGWHWRLSAELLRHLNKPIFRRLADLRDGLYSNDISHLDDEGVIGWLGQCMHEGSALIQPMPILLERLQSAWLLDEDDDIASETLHICELMRDALARAVEHEERIYFTNLPDGMERMHDLVKQLVGSQVEKFAALPDYLDEVVALIGTDHGGTNDVPYVVERSIKFEVPEGWSESMELEMAHIVQLISRRRVH